MLTRADLTLYAVQSVGVYVGACGASELEAVVVLGRDDADEMSRAMMGNPDVGAVHVTPLVWDSRVERDEMAFGSWPLDPAPAMLAAGLAAGLDIEGPCGYCNTCGYGGDTSPDCPHSRFDWTAVLGVLRDPAQLAEALAEQRANAAYFAIGAQGAPIADLPMHGPPTYRAVLGASAADWRAGAVLVAASRARLTALHGLAGPQDNGAS